MPLPYIRYAREISQDVADIKRRDRLKEEGSMKHVTINEPMSPTKVTEHFYYIDVNVIIFLFILSLWTMKYLYYSINSTEDCLGIERTKENWITWI